MWATLRRKVVSAGSSAMGNGTIETFGRARPALGGSTSQGLLAATPMSEALNLGNGSTLLRQYHQGGPVYAESARSAVSSLKTGFPTQTWSRSYAAHGATSLQKSGKPVEFSETICQIRSNEGLVLPVAPNAGNMNFAGTEKSTNDSTSVDRKTSFMISSGVCGSLLSTPIVNAPQTAQMAMPAIASPTFLPNLALFWHINNGVEEILADYVHHEMTRGLMLIIIRLFLIIAAKDIFLLTN